MSDLLHRLGDWAVALMERFGYFAVFFLVALENLIPPIPSEAILPLAGFTASTGSLTLVGVMLAATLGSVVGALVLYAIGRGVGETRLRRFIRRFSWLPFVDEDDLDKTERWFARHGGKAVLLGRLVPVIRSVVSIPAGFERMPVGRFTLYTALGSAAWNGILVAAGWALGERWSEVRGYTQYLEYGVVLAIAGAIGWFIYRKWSGARATAAGRSAMSRADE